MPPKFVLVVALAVAGCVHYSDHRHRPQAHSQVELSGISIRFDHFGLATNPLDQRMIESRGVTSSELAGEDIWLRLVNESDQVINFRTDSMYFRPLPEWDAFPNGKKYLSLKDGAEISIQFGIQDHRGREVQYGVDFGFKSRLRPGCSVLFSIPKAALENGQSIYVAYSTEDPATAASRDEGFRVNFHKTDMPGSVP